MSRYDNTFDGENSPLDVFEFVGRREDGVTLGVGLTAPSLDLSVAPDNAHQVIQV